MKFRLDRITSNKRQNNFWMFAAFQFLSFVLFLPIINKPLVSDDYQVIYRLIRENNFFIKGFFRPLSDFTLYLTHQLVGLKPIYYNAFNIAMHGASTYLLYSLCLKIHVFPIQKTLMFALVSSLLFISYPFHNESIAWAVGRGSVMACFFSALSLYILCTNLPENLKCFLASFFYFIGLCSYETIVPLPLIALFIASFGKNRKKSFFAKLITCFIITLGLAVLIRLYLAEAIMGGYGDRLLSIHSLVRYFKGFGRLFLPPIQNSSLFSIAFFVLMSLLIVVGFFVYKKRQSKWMQFLVFCCVFFISTIIPCMFGVSTKTIEGDRLLYFPSFFLCLLLGFLALLINRKKCVVFFVAALLLYNVAFLQIFNQVWRKAGSSATRIITTVEKYSSSNASFVLLNIPREYKGAYIFRNGFKEAMLLHNIDTTKIDFCNFMSSDNFHTSDEKTQLAQSGNLFFLKPNIVIRGAQIFIKDETERILSYYIKPDVKILYWTGNKMEIVSP